MSGITVMLHISDLQTLIRMKINDVSDDSDLAHDLCVIPIKYSVYYVSFGSIL